MVCAWCDNCGTERGVGMYADWGEYWDSSTGLVRHVGLPAVTIRCDACSSRDVQTFDSRDEMNAMVEEREAEIGRMWAD